VSNGFTADLPAAVPRRGLAEAPRLAAASQAQQTAGDTRERWQSVRRRSSQPP